MNEYVRAYTRIESRAERRGSFARLYAPWLVLLTAAAIFGRVWNQTQAVRLADELTRLQTEERELLQTREEHERALIGLTTRERIARVAREDLGMSYPSEQEIVFLAVPGNAAVAEQEAPRRVERPPGGFVEFLAERLRGVVNREAYALSTM
ncbi:MAG: septum formation initiator family protein [Gemmatimonadetes bacterium]|nr:septum formation initiator family protein [Gemmatimonadota bacterium]